MCAISRCVVSISSIITITSMSITLTLILIIILTVVITNLSLCRTHTFSFSISLPFFVYLSLTPTPALTPTPHLPSSSQVTKVLFVLYLSHPMDSTWCQEGMTVPSDYGRWTHHFAGKYRARTHLCILLGYFYPFLLPYLSPSEVSLS